MFQGVYAVFERACFVLQGMFSMEAGRRCASGPGTFSFSTAQGGQIFACVEAAIREQRVLAEEEPGSGPAPCEPGGRSPGLHTGAALLDDPSGVYSLPLDCLRQPAPPTEPVYAAPLDLLQDPPPRPRRDDAPDPPVCSRPERQGALRGSPKPPRARPPPNPAHPPEPPDLDALYSQVTKHPSTSITWDPDSDDIVYDNLGVI